MTVPFTGLTWLLLTAVCVIILLCVCACMYVYVCVFACMYVYVMLSACTGSGICVGLHLPAVLSNCVHLWSRIFAGMFGKLCEV